MSELRGLLRACEEYGLGRALSRREVRATVTFVVADDETDEARRAIEENLGSAPSPVSELSESSLDVAVVVSAKAENALWDGAVAALPDHPRHRVLRLWSDLLVTKLARFPTRTDVAPADLLVPQPRGDAAATALGDLTIYGVVCAPRTGSTLLCDLLFQAGYGDPREHLRAGLVDVLTGSDLVVGDVVAGIADSAARNGVFGTKLISHLLNESLRSSPLVDVVPDQIRDRARIIRLRRSDHCAQAVSTQVAVGSRVFFEHDAGKAAQREAYLRDYVYDFAALHKILRVLEHDEDALDRKVAATGLPVLEVEYDRVLADPGRVVEDVAAFLGVPTDRTAAIGAARTTKLDDSLTTPIVERFRRDLARERSASPPAPVAASAPDATHDTGPYQAKDWEIVDYAYYRPPGSTKVFRGPAPDLDAPYLAALGAAQTLGRFCPEPYPNLVGDEIGLGVLNLGFSGAGPAFYLEQPALIDLANAAELAIVQVMSARSIGNSMMESRDGRNVVTWRPTGEEMLAEQAYRRLLADSPRWKLWTVVRESRRNWLRAMGDLLDALDVPVYLLWFSERQPAYRARYGRGLYDLLGAFPHLVTASMMRRLQRGRPHVRYVEAVSRAGMPHPLVSRFTGEISPVQFPNGEWKDADESYPSPQMQQVAAAALLPEIRALR